MMQQLALEHEVSKPSRTTWSRSGQSRPGNGARFPGQTSKLTGLQMWSRIGESSWASAPPVSRIFAEPLPQRCSRRFALVLRGALRELTRRVAFVQPPKMKPIIVASDAQATQLQVPPDIPRCQGFQCTEISGRTRDPRRTRCCLIRRNTSEPHVSCQMSFS